MSEQDKAPVPSADWPCPWCHRTSGFETLFKVADDLQDYDDVFGAAVLVYKCRACRRSNVAYFTLESCTDSKGELVDYWACGYHLPPRLDCGIQAHLLLARLYEERDAVSWALDSLVEETLKAFDAECYTLAALGARRAMEYHLQAKGFDGPLERAIIEAEKAWGQLFKGTAEEIREWGNAAAHDTRPFTRGNGAEELTLSRH